MHMAAANLSLDVYPKIIALVMYGDPGEKQNNTRVQRFPVYLGSRLIEICAPGDPVSSVLLNIRSMDDADFSNRSVAMAIIKKHIHHTTNPVPRSYKKV